jgi:hypothetical protein
MIASLRTEDAGGAENVVVVPQNQVRIDKAFALFRMVLYLCKCVYCHYERRPCRSVVMLGLLYFTLLGQYERLKTLPLFPDLLA